VFAKAYWWALWLVAFGALVAGRFAVPLWRNAYHQFRVASVVAESGDVVSVRVTGRHLDRLPARAGQFFIWRFPAHNHWWLANPFSLSAAPDGRSLRLTARAAGATSAGLRNVPVGSRAFLEGPYGAFTSLHRTRSGALLIAGGVGITPVRAMLEEPTPGDVVVLYRVRTEQDAVLLNEVRALVTARGGRLHVLTGRTGDGVRPFSPEGLSSLVPDIASRDVYVCGPSAMTDAVMSALRTLRVPGQQVHAEKFSLA
jgi:ferredoxin-NADP reductase